MICRRDQQVKFVPFAHERERDEHGVGWLAPERESLPAKRGLASSVGMAAIGHLTVDEAE